MPEICCVLNCPHVSGQCQFRSFPKDPERCLMWKRNIHQNNMVIKKQTRICDCHFESNMFWQNKEGKRNLRANALPSVAAPKLRDTQVQGTLAQLKKCRDNIKTKRKRDNSTESRLITKTGGDPPPPTASATPELELAVPHLGHNVGFWFDSDAGAIRSPPDLSAPTCIQLDTAAAGSSFNAQDSQCTPVATESNTASSSSQDQSCDASTDRDAPVTVEEGQNYPSLSNPHPKRCLSRESLVEDELEQRMKRHRLQMECDLKLQSLREKELQLLMENARKEEERRRQAYEWKEERRKLAFELEEERRKLAFEWEEERRKKAFEAEERRKEEMHKMTKGKSAKNINKEETMFQLQFVQTALKPRSKRRYSGCCEEHDPGAKRQKTNAGKPRNVRKKYSSIPMTEILYKGSQAGIEGVPLVQKEMARVTKRNQIGSEGTPSPKQVARVPKRSLTEIESAPSAKKEVARVTKRSQIENASTPFAKKEVARVTKRSQTENASTLSAKKGMARVTKLSQIESEGTPPAQKEVARAPKRSQIQNGGTPPAHKVVKAPKRSTIEIEGAPSAQKEVASVPKIKILRMFKIQREVPPLEKPKVTKPPDKEVAQETENGTKTTSKKIWCKLDEICRLCIKKCYRPTNVYDNDLAFKIQAISSIRGMYSTDGLPVNVCQDCKDMTNIFYSFKLQCEAADETLRTCLKALQAGESNDTVVKQQTVAKPLFPELFKFSAFSSDDSDIEEVDSEVMEEEEEEALHTVPAVPVVQTVPAVPAVQTVPAVQAPAIHTAPAVKTVPVVRKVAAVHKVPVVQTAIPSTSTMRTRDRSPPSRSLQDELNKAWTEFTHEEGGLLVTRKSTATARKENKPQPTESRNVVAKRKSVTKSVTSPKPAIVVSSASQKELGQGKDELQKESTPCQAYKPQLIERQNKPLQGKAELMKYLGNNVEVTQQKQLKGTRGNVMVTMVNNPKRAYNTKVDQHKTDSVNLNQKTLNVNAESKADKQNGSGENVTTKATVLDSDSLFKVKRVSSEASEMKKLGPTMSAFKVGALGQNVEIYRIPGQKPKPLISKPAVVENKSPTTSTTKDLTLQRTQIQEKTAKIQDSNGHLAQGSKPENSPLCHIEIFKVQNHSDRKLCLTALEGTDVSLHPVAQVPSTKLVSLANKLEQNLQPVVKSTTKMLVKNVSDNSAITTENLEHTSDDNTPSGEVEERLQPVLTSVAEMHVQDGESSTSDKEKSEQNRHIKGADDDAFSTRTLEPVLTSDPKVHLQVANDNATGKLRQNLQSELTNDAKEVLEENDINTPATEKLEKNLQPELLSDAETHISNSDDSTATTGELEQTSDTVLTGDTKVHAQNGNTTSPTSEKPVKTFPRPCKSISLPIPALTTAVGKKAEETVENLEPKEHANVTENEIEDESEKNMQLQEQEACIDTAKTVEVEKVSDITQNIVEELLNGAAMFADTDSVEPEVPLSLGEPVGKTNEAEQLGDILGSRHETELSHDISKLIDQTEAAVDTEEVKDKKKADKPDDTTNEKQSEAEELETVEEASKLQENTEECSQDTAGGDAVVSTDCDEKPVDRKRGLDRTDDERQCHICAKSFPVSALQRHIASHWSQKDLLCEKCGISFFFPADLERHVISHGPQELTGNKEDSSAMKQQQQQQPRVSRQRTFTCGACGMDFTNWFQLRDHKLIHKKGRRHRCGSCSKHFRTKYLLQNHMWVHTMLKKPNCELCGKTFSLPWYVDRHIAEEHS